MKVRSKKKIIIAVLCVTIFIALAAAMVYVNDYYHADMERIEAFPTENPVEVKKDEENNISFIPENAKAGMIFYPGGKVEHTAYIPLMKELASEGVLCVLVEMPFRLAVLDSDAAEGICEQYPDIKKWYMAGHSLGGSMAATYLSDHEEEYEGLILLASYTLEDLSNTELSALLVSGSEDQVLNRENYEDNKRNLPKDFTEIVIEGGCHAFFGMYGEQERDGTPAIANEEQIRLTAEEMLSFISIDISTQ